MSTATLSPTRAPQPPAATAISPTPFTRLLHVELRKLTNTRAGRGVVLAILLITALAMGVTLWVGRDAGVELPTILAVAGLPQGLLLPVLGILTVANEWSQRTALVTFTQEPRRLRVMAAKSVAATVLGLGVLVVTVLLAMAAHALSMSLAGGGSIDLSLTLASLTGLAVVQVQGVLLGVAFGALFLNVPLAVVAYFLIPVVSNLVFALVPWLSEHAAWLDLTTAAGPLAGEAWPSAEQWAQVGTSSAIWLLLPLAIGLWRVARREVK